MAITLEDFRAAFKGDITGPQDHDYARLVTRWSPNEESRPLLIVEPLTESDVSWAVRYATSNKFEIAVNSGGHSFMGATSSNAGVTIDLRRMKQVYVENEHFGADGVLHLQGGVLVGEVAAACVARGVITSIPAHKDLSYAGWSVGAGAGWSMGKYGFAIDSWLSARVVLASGEAVTASPEENPDLFWALKGAGYNFGIITSLQVRVESCPHRIFFGLLCFRPSEFEALFAATATYAKTQQDEDTMAIIYTTQDGQGRPKETMLAILYYQGSDEAEARRRFKPILDLPHIALRCGLEWFHAACDMVEPTMPRTRRYADGTLFAHISLDAWKPAIAKMRNWVGTDPTRRLATEFFFGIYNWRSTFARHGDPRFESAYPIRDKLPPGGEPSWRDFALYISTNKLEDEEEAISVCREVVSLVREKQEEYLGVKKGYQWPVYPNGALLPGVLGSYVFQEHYPRLREVKTKYDRRNIFHKKHPIEPLQIS
ncbi:hypothetical protein B0J12DRAFT_579547 [Macrophomina phaseolina]|uniref:FAD-binding PCMH-type domain-containing protein n=1 Tax=Macrophomina phaseolina TaxID=35725 RepID=A0ABQ8G4J0_9PEZI|nr:hypothetical protein B0J12DRAFT_579547 [Macrophomina phaseolina]